MEISQVEKNRLVKLCNIRNSNPNIELECLMNNKESIHFTEFTKLLKYIKNLASLNTDSEYTKNTWKLISIGDTLDITVYRNDNINMRTNFDIRTTITSKEDISSFCQTNSLEGLKTKQIFKTNYNIHKGIQDSLKKEVITEALILGDKVILNSNKNGTIQGIITSIENISSSQKKYTITDKKGIKYQTSDYNDIKLSNYGIYLEDYDIKINFKTEIDLETLDSIVDKNYHEEEASKSKNLFETFINANGGFENVYKTFRLKNRYSFRYNSMRLDLTIVRSSRKELNNKGFMVQKPTKNLIESNLINEDKEYEVELEIDYNYEERETIYNSKNIDTRILDILYDLKLHINNYPSVISKKEYTIVSETYKSLIRHNHKNILEKKLNIINYMLQQKELEELDKKTEEEKQNYLDTTDLLNIDDISSEYVSQYQTLIENNDSNIVKLKQKYENMLENIKYVKFNYSNNKTYFIGPNVVSMNIKDIQTTSSDNILKENYSITDKADGLGMLMYIFGMEHLTDSEITKITNIKDITAGKEMLRSYNSHIYLIDRNMKIYKTHLSLRDDLQDNYTNTLLNGEYLDNDTSNNRINMYKIYDAYIFNGKDIKYLPLKSKKTNKESRITYIHTLLDTEEDINKDKLLYKNNTFTNYDIYILQISKKKFLYSYPKVSKKNNKITTTLFKHSKELWDTFKSNLSIYKYDGLIYTPTDLPVGYSDNSCDYDLTTNTTWNKNIKWKPPYENTIDFLIKEVKEETSINGNVIYSPLIKTKRNNVDGNVIYKKYKTFHLYVGKNITDSNNSCIKKYNQKNRYLPVQFVPSILYDDMAYVANIEVNPENNEAYTSYWDHTTNEWKTNSFDIIKDNTVVEFAYSNFDKEDGHYKTDKSFRWIPIRTRHDKTFSYKKGTREKIKMYNILKYILQLGKNTYNESSNVIFKRSIRKYINLIKHIILDVPKIKVNYKTKNINSILNDILYNKDKIVMYYSSYEYISKHININYGNNFNTANSNWFSIHNPITEDMITTGKDIPNMDIYELKYYNQKIDIKRSKSISIQLQKFHNNIKLHLIQDVCKNLRKDNTDTNINLLDLACGKGGDIYKWINNQIHNVVGIDKVYDNIYNTSDGACVRRKNYSEQNNNKMPIMDFVVADVSKDLTDTSNFVDMFSQDIWFSKYLDKKFDIVTMMFALHYMFNSEESVSMLIQNINNNIKKGGYFIGCCFDGKAVFDLLQDININQTKNGYKDGEIIWKIKKKYSLSSWEQTEKNIFYDLPIDVYMRSINMNITEYLVNFDIFVEKLKNLNIKLVETKLFKDIYNNKKNKYKNLTEDEEKVSFLNRMFIFQKISDKDIVINNITDIAFDIIHNEYQENTFKTIKNKKLLIKELKKNNTSGELWNHLQILINEYIQEQNLKENMPILDIELDLIMLGVFNKLKSKISDIKLKK